MNTTTTAYNSEPERVQMTKKNPAAQALGRLGGTKGTKAQQQARRANGARGGRPRRICEHCGKPVGERFAAAARLERTTDALLRDVLTAFEGEEQTVQQKHADVIARVRAAVAKL